MLQAPPYLLPLHPIYCIACTQDFFGVIEELRVWRVVRSAQQIREGREADDGRGPGEGGEEEGGLT